ncbi:MAG TPA: TolC family protein [Terriglobales bacterium]|nr:TolC family protein [Terriglobales bacterium]
MSVLLPARMALGSLSCGVALLAGCATYRPLVLPATPNLATLPALTVRASRFALPGRPPRPLPRNGLDETAVMTLAVFNNPDLQAARLQSGIADAQLLQAGLLPDPVVGAGFARSALHNGFNLGLSQDLHALFTRGAALAAARAHQRQVSLGLEWQEWQVAARASQLFLQAQADNQLQPLLLANRDLLAQRYQQDQAALQAGNLTLASVAPNLSALTDADDNLRLLQADADLTRHQLLGLLGLDPGVHLPLVGRDQSPALSSLQFHQAVAALPQRRADLLALAAGYQAQEQALRQAILAQFPALTATVSQARDPVEGVNSIGAGVTLTLPLFNRNRGGIALQRATRAQLRQTYQARLDQAVGDADQVWAAARILRAQLGDLEQRLPALATMAAAARQSVQNRNLEADLYVNLESTRLARQAQAIRLRTALAQANSSLRILLGLPLGAP